MRAVIVGQAKTGTTALHARLLRGARAALDGDVGGVFEPWDVLSVTDDAVEFRHGTSSTVTCTEPHLVVKAVLENVPGGGGFPMETAIERFTSFDRRIHLVRDPRDRWVSAFFYRWFHRHDPDPADFERALAMVRRKEADPGAVALWRAFPHDGHPDELLGGWRERNDRFGDFARRARAAGWFTHRYEDMIDDRNVELEQWLGFPLSTSTRVDERFARVARAMRSGDWRRWFTDEDVEVLRPVFDPLLTELGYDADDWELEQPNSLPSSEGSEYMLKLFIPDASGSG